MRIVLGLVLALVMLPSAGIAQEARCVALGANCLASEPLQMTSFAFTAGDYYNPNDSTSKQFNGDFGGLGGNAIQQPGGISAPLIGTDAAVLAALPPGTTAQTNGRFLRWAQNYTGARYMSHTLAGGDPRERVAIRWYDFYSSDYAYANKSNPAACQNSAKWFAAYFPGAANVNQWDTPSGGNSVPIIYAWDTFSPISGRACCNWGPGWTTFGTIPANVLSRKLGKWYRHEVILRHTDGTAGMTYLAYRKNITDNEPEYKVIDTSVECTGCGDNTANDWTNASGATTALHAGQLSRVEINMFRNPGTDPNGCTGYRAFLYAVVAAWNTDAGQRIDAASEIEVVTTPPTAPSNLRFTRAAPVAPSNLRLNAVRLSPWAVAVIRNR